MSAARAPLPAALAEATAEQPRVRLMLAAALASGPSHAYLLRGPRGSGKRAAARAFAAEIIAAGAPDPDDARRRVLLDPSPHPDLAWLVPTGTSHLVGEVRSRVIRAAALRPFEGVRRVFVIEAAEAMADESQNALLKTLEEPPDYAHLILLSADPEMLRETIISRCQSVPFAPRSAAALREALAGQGKPQAVAAAAALAGGDGERARFLLSEGGTRVRSQAEACVTASLGEGSTGPWNGMLEVATSVGEEAEAAAAADLEAAAEEGARHSAREAEQEARRAGRRRRTEMLDLGLELCGLWLRDLIAVRAEAEEAVLNRDRFDQLREQAAGVDPLRARRGAELVAETRRRLDLNVSEELALEALRFRLESLLAVPG